MPPKSMYVLKKCIRLRLRIEKFCIFCSIIVAIHMYMLIYFSIIKTIKDLTPYAKSNEVK